MSNVVNGNPTLKNRTEGRSSRQNMWFLVGRLSPNESPRQLPVYVSPFRIGRQSGAALCLPSKAISSMHAELSEEGDTLLLKDLGSTNGTFVNGRRVRDIVELSPDDLVQFASFPFRIARQSVSANLKTVSEDAFDCAMLLVQFDRLMAEDALIPYYQPIVELRNDAVIGCEVLARSAVVGLESPAAMFSAATQLNLQAKLSQMMRWKGVQQTLSLEPLPHLFLNTHPIELSNPDLIESMRSLREMSSRQPITLEIHEAAVTEKAAMQELRRGLCELNIRLAFDDFGAGQARLAELVEVHPDYLKFDISLIRNLHQAPSEKVRMVGSLVRMVRDMEIEPLAEGIECQAERDICAELGFNLGQGYFFGKPVPLHVG